MAIPPMNIQDTFLNVARIRNIPVTVLLVNGARVSGRIQGFDKFTIILEGQTEQQMIFKHAIATVSPASAIKDLFRPQPKRPTADEPAPK
ncbi:MAG: RNA chaperone Hfq [Candidatus Coatesbacteria bacterium]|nr:RNA chaperone Hfq [Candidatus Coatesbacteria bacterium]